MLFNDINRHSATYSTFVENSHNQRGPRIVYISNLLSMNSFFETALANNFSLETINGARYVTRNLSNSYKFAVRVEAQNIVAPQILDADSGEVDNTLVDDLLSRIIKFGSMSEDLNQKLAFFFKVAELVIEDRTQFMSA